MAKVYTKQDICVSDYFSRYGFDGGDDDEIGLRCLKIAVDILNKHLDLFRVQARHSTDGDSKYNNCRIYFTSDIALNLGAVDDDLMYDVLFWSSRVELPEESAKVEWAEGVVAALQAASKEFEWACLDDLSKVIQSKQKDLPLLAGRLHDEEALKVFQWRMKGGLDG
jgi:hypothetical protein